jgi:hypothetical protein
MAAALSKTRVLILIMTHDKEISSGGGGGSFFVLYADPLVGLFGIVIGRNGWCRLRHTVWRLATKGGAAVSAALSLV